MLLEEGLEGAVFPVMGEPGSGHIKEVRLLRSLRRIFEERESGLRVYEALYQPDAGRAVHVAPPARKIRAGARKQGRFGRFVGRRWNPCPVRSGLLCRRRE